MSAQVHAASPATGLTTVVDVIAAPKSAFERLREVPTWGWAFLIAFVLMLVGYILQHAAIDHANLAYTQHLASNPQFNDAQRAKMIANAEHPGAPQRAIAIITYGVTLFIACLVNSFILLIGNAVGGGQADFKRLWCASMNIAVPTIGIVAILIGIITIARGPQSFAGPMDVQMSMPGLHMLAPNGSPVLKGFLGGFSLGTIWGLILNGTMMTTLARVKPAVAWGFSFLVTLLGAAMIAGLASFMSLFKA